MLGKLEVELVIKGVYIVTSAWKNNRAGMTAAWITRVCETPPLMLVAVHMGSFTGQVIEQSGWYVINILDQQQLNIARQFGSVTSRDHDKFKGLRLLTSLNGYPALGEALGYLECKVRLTQQVGDHRLFIGEITEEKKLRNGRPLIYSPVLET